MPLVSLTGPYHEQYRPLSRTICTRAYNEDARDTFDWWVGRTKILAVSGRKKLHRLVESTCDSSSAGLSNGSADAREMQSNCCTNAAGQSSQG